MKIIKIADLALIILVSAVAVIDIIFLRHTQKSLVDDEVRRTVVIEVAGEEAVRLPLDENKIYSIEREDMRNVIVVEDGSVYMSEADCPNQNCVRQGKITEVGVPIVCLPHQVIVMIVEEAP